MMKAANATLLWNPGTDQVKVLARPHSLEATDGFERSGLGAWSAVKSMTPTERRAQVFIEAMHLIIRDGCDPLAVHNALLQVEEYREGCADDMPGAQ